MGPKDKIHLLSTVYADSQLAFLNPYTEENRKSSSITAAHNTTLVGKKTLVRNYSSNSTLWKYRLDKLMFISVVIQKPVPYSVQLKPLNYLMLIATANTDCFATRPILLMANSWKKDAPMKQSPCRQKSMCSGFLLWLTLSKQAQQHVTHGNLS